MGVTSIHSHSHTPSRRARARSPAPPKNARACVVHSRKSDRERESEGEKREKKQKKHITPPHMVRTSLTSPFKKSATSAPPSLEAPYTRSTNTMGTSAITAPDAAARTATSIWKA